MLIPTLVFWAAAIGGVLVGGYQMIRLLLDDSCDCNWCAHE